MQPGERHWEAVARILEKRDWRLVEDVERFAADVEAEVQRRLPGARRAFDSIVEDAVINQYGPVWHAACMQNGSLRQRRGFEELFEHLHRIALYRAHHDEAIALDSTQASLETIWGRLPTVRDPHAFMRYCNLILVRQVLARLAEASRVMVVEPTGDEELDPLEIVPDPTPPPDERPGAMTPGLRARLEVAIRHCLANPDMQVIIIRLYLDHQGLLAVVNELNLSPKQIAVHKHRALKGLRRCEAFMTTLEELL